MATTTRVLPPEEYDRLAEHEPFASNGIPTPDHWRVVVVEDEGVIVGFCCMYNAVHWEPWWIAEEYRGRPGIIRQLVKHSEALLVDAKVKTVFVTIEDGFPARQDLVEHFQFQPAPGKLFFRHMPEEY